MKLPALTLTSCLALLFASSTPAQEKLILRQHWEPGKAYYFESNTDMQMDMPALPGGQTTNVIQFMDILVSKKPGSDQKLAEMKYSAIKAMINAGGQLMTYDSTDPAMSQPMLQQAFGALLGKSITIVYDKDDKFSDVIVPDNFMPTPLGAGLGPDGKQFGEMLRQNFTFGLPDSGLAPGETFTQEKKMNMKPLGDITIKMTGKFDGVIDHEGRKHAKITLQGTMDGLKLPAEAAGAVTIEPGTTISGETLFDLERKVVTRNTVKNEMKMTAGGQAITMKQNMTTTLKKIGDTPPPAAAAPKPVPASDAKSK